MALQSQNKIAWLYTDDNSDTYRRSAAKAITDQKDGDDVKVGGSSGAAEDAVMPTNLKPRYAICQASDGTQRKVVCHDTTCLLWSTRGTAITLNKGSDSASFTQVGRRGERQGKATNETT